MSTVYVSGTDNLIAKLRNITRNKAKQAIRRGSRAGSKLIAEEAKQDAPKATGALQRAIKVRALARSRRWIGTTTRLQIRYGSFVNLGTKRMKARAFLQLAVKNKKSSAANEMIDTIKREIVT